MFANVSFFRLLYNTKVTILDSTARVVFSTSRPCRFEVGPSMLVEDQPPQVTLLASLHRNCCGTWQKSESSHFERIAFSMRNARDTSIGAKHAGFHGSVPKRLRFHSMHCSLTGSALLAFTPLLRTRWQESGRRNSIRLGCIINLGDSESTMVKE